MSVSWGVLCLCFSAAAAAPSTDLGVHGRLYPIAERDLLELIEQRLRGLDLQAERQAARRRATRYLEQGPPGAELPRAAHRRVRYLDPSVRLHGPLPGVRNGPVVSGGTINPLEHQPLSRRLLFFDARDPLQRAWVRRRLPGERWKLVLTAGAPAPLMRAWGHPVYFDQHGLLRRRLGIEALPSVVRQEGNRLRIEEIPPE